MSTCRCVTVIFAERVRFARLVVEELDWSLREQVENVDCP